MANKLTALGIEKLTSTGRYSDGGGLYLNISKDGTKSWLFRYQLNGKRRWKGLGAYNPKANSLAMARVNAIEVKLLLNKNMDPLEIKARAKIEKKEAEVLLERKKRLNQMSFDLVAAKYIEVKRGEWSNKKHYQQWINTLKTYVSPHIGKSPVSEIEIEDVLTCLTPIWQTKTETATRVRQRMESVFNFAIAYKYREKTNPATWRGLLDQMLPNPNSIKRIKYEENGKVQHHNALPYQDAPLFYSNLKEMTGIAPLALRFLILTTSRTSEICLAEWSEINVDKQEWTLPASRMKARKMHRVALSDDAIKLLNTLPRVNGFLFPGSKYGKAISSGGMAAVLKRMGRTDITVHGFRSTFRDYIGEETGFPFRIAEFALAHGLKDGAEKAYARGDMFKKRYKMMNHWSDYLEGRS